MWRVTLLILGIAVAGYSCSTGASDSSQKPVDRLESGALTTEDAVREAAFRYELEDNEFAHSKPNSLMYFAIGRIDHSPTDPSDALYGHLANLRPKVRPISRAHEARGYFVDNETGDEGLVLAVIDVVLSGPNDAIVDTEYYLGPLEGGGRGLHLVRRDDRWLVISATPHWNS